MYDVRVRHMRLSTRTDGRAKKNKTKKRRRGAKRNSRKRREGSSTLVRNQSANRFFRDLFLAGKAPLRRQFRRIPKCEETTCISIRITLCKLCLRFLGVRVSVAPLAYTIDKTSCSRWRGTGNTRAILHSKLDIIKYSGQKPLDVVKFLFIPTLVHAQYTQQYRLYMPSDVKLGLL